MNIPTVRQTPPNPCAARENRLAFDTLGLIGVHVYGPTGSGKTTLLESLLMRLRYELRIGVVEGDLAISRDGQRIAALEVPTVQVLTDDRPALGADQLQRGMAELPLENLDLLVVENTGAGATAGYQKLGEHIRVAVLSVAAGDEQAVKQPHLVQDAHVVVLSKFSLREAVTFNLEQVREHIQQINPSAEVLMTDARQRIGIDRLAGWLLGNVRAQCIRRERQSVLALGDE
jgi:hydrogenase nickel incorporation protein HypB